MLRFLDPRRQAIFGLVLLGLLVATTSHAAPVKMPSDLQFVQDSNMSFVSIKPSALLDSGVVKKLPAELMKEMNGPAVLQERLGMTLADLDRVTILVVHPAREPVGVFRSNKPYDREKVLQGLLPRSVKIQHKGRTIYSTGPQGRIAICPIDNRVLLGGSVREIKAALDAVAKKSDPLLEDAIGFALKGHHIVVGGTPMVAFGALYGMRMGHGHFHEHGEDLPVPVPPLGQPEDVPVAPPVPLPPPPPPPGAVPGTEPAPEPDDPFQIAFQPVPGVVEIGPDGEEHFHMPSMKELLDELPPEMLPFKPLFQSKTLAFGFTLDMTTSVEWKIRYANKDLAEDGETAVRTLFYVMRELLPMMSRELLDRDASESPQLAAFFTQVKKALRAAPIERENTDLAGKITLEIKPETVAALTVELRREAVKTTSANNLKQLVLAMHNYHDAMGAFPSAAITDKKGKPLLSWRVAILPYIEEDQLYKQFKLDEPWDSAHNKKLLAKMPKVFEAVANKPKKANSTYYRVFVGPRTPFDPRWARPGQFPRGGRLQNLHDGTSNTFLVVEASESVEWTKPEPLTFDPKKAVPKLGGMFPGGFQVGMADGSVHFFKKEIGQHTLKLLIDGQDGQPVNWYRFTKRNRGRGYGQSTPGFPGAPPVQVEPFPGVPVDPDVPPPPPGLPGRDPEGIGQPVREKPVADKPVKPRDR